MNAAGTDFGTAADRIPHRVGLLRQPSCCRVQGEPGQFSPLATSDLQSWSKRRFVGRVRKLPNRKVVRRDIDMFYVMNGQGVHNDFKSFQATLRGFIF
jgi:hypothetical protein